MSRLRPQPLDREILRLAVPAFFTLVAEPLYILADTAVVGRIGTEELGGLAIASSILLVGYSLFIFLAYGTTGTVARLIGAGDPGAAAQEAVQSLWLALGLGIAWSVLIGVFSAELVRLLGAEGAVATNALIYLRVSLLGFPSLLLVLAGTGYLRGLQDTRTPLVVAIGSAVANLVLELIFVFGLGYGIGASALATVIAQTAAAAVFVWRVLVGVRAHHAGLRPHAASLRRLMRSAGDLFVRTAALRGVLLVSTAVAARLGLTALAAHQIAFEIWSFLALALDAVAIAGQAMIGRLLGSGDASAARAAGNRMVDWGVFAGIVLAIGVGALHGVLPKIFTEDEAVIATASFLLVLAALLQPLNGLVFTLDGILIGAGDLRFLAKAMVISSAVFGIGALAVLATDSGIGWLWGALAAWMTTRAVTLGLRYRGTAWQVTGV